MKQAITTLLYIRACTTTLSSSLTLRGRKFRIIVVAHLTMIRVWYNHPLKMNANLIWTLLDSHALSTRTSSSSIFVAKIKSLCVTTAYQKDIKNMIQKIYKRDATKWRMLSKPNWTRLYRLSSMLLWRSQWYGQENISINSLMALSMKSWLYINKWKKSIDKR